jgi:hypothetical protein
VRLLALSVRQPWAWAIFALGKIVENRTWEPPRSVIGRDIAIQAGKTAPERADWEAMWKASGRPAPWEAPMQPLALGAVLGVVRVLGLVRDDHVHRQPLSRAMWVEAETSPWREVAPHVIGWVLGAPRLLHEPIPVRGFQGLWPLEMDVDAEIREQIGELA